MAKPVLIGDTQFPSRSAALAACKAALHRYQLHEEVSELVDRQLLADLVQLHRDPLSKIGAGIVRFEVRRNPENPRIRSFFIVRVDGTETDFGYTKLIQPPSQRQLVERAMRRIVAQQIIDFADSEFTRQAVVTCPITGTKMQSRDEAHVDHYDPEFVVLAAQFSDARGGWDAIDLVSADGQVGQRFQDEALTEEWLEYHLDTANLRLVTKQANLSLLRRH